MRVIAVDWSGAVHGAEKKIWLAEVRDRQLVRLESGRSRKELVEHLIYEAGKDSELVVGLDFAFSMPSWFLEEQGVETARDLWPLVEREGEDWLQRCDPPFWGRPGKGLPALPAMPDRFRKAERLVKQHSGFQPKSVFQIGGAGAVGTGSLRGMPHLLRLTDAGFSVWPFDEPRMPLVVEIYPRLFTGSVVTAKPDAALAYYHSNREEVEGYLRDEEAEDDRLSQSSEASS